MSNSYSPRPDRLSSSRFPPAQPIAPPRRKLWKLFFMPVLLVVAAIGWSAFWFYAASTVDEKFDGWRTREARSGRTYDCANRSVAGYPFRLEVRCDNPVVSLTSQTPTDAATGATITARLKDILVVAQIYDPRLLIAEFTGPAVVTQRDQSQPFAVANWTTARASVAGLPILPQRVSMVFDDPAVDLLANADQAQAFRAKHLEVHARLLDGAVTDNPVIETVFEVDNGSLPNLHPLLAEPFNVDLRAQLRGLKDLAPKPWPQRLREIQQAGGRIEIEPSRLQQGDTIAVGSGSLGLTADGYLDGEVQMTVAGIEKIIPALGIDKMLAEGVSQSSVDRVAPGVRAQDVNKVIGALDRMLPGLGNIARQNANAGVAAGINLLGHPATLEGKKALAFPLKFVAGAVYLGPLKVAQTPPLF